MPKLHAETIYKCFDNFSELGKKIFPLTFYRIYSATVAMPLLEARKRQERDGAMADGLTYTNKIARERE